MDMMYRDEILDLYREPLNFGKLDTFDVSSRQLNPFCGDEIEMFVKFQENSVERIAFSGRGCVICIASTSLLTDFAKKKTKKALTKFSEKDMLTLLGIEVSESRKKCALLGLAVLRDCINDAKI